MIFNFYINDIEVEEPVGFDGTTIKLKRSDKWHGVMVESNDNKLQFYGDGYRMLKALYDASGIDAVAVFKVETVCEGERVESTEFNITFFEYKEYCGGDCYCEVGIERAGCFFKFRNSLDTKVDLDTTASLNGVPLPSYNYLGKVTEIPAQALKYGVEANVNSNSVYDFVVDDPLYSALLQTDLSIKNDAYIFSIFPPYNAIFEDINTSNIYDVWNRNVEGIVNGYYYGANEEILQNNINQRCGTVVFNVDLRFAMDIYSRKYDPVSWLQDMSCVFIVGVFDKDYKPKTVLHAITVTPTVNVLGATEKEFNWSIDETYTNASVIADFEDRIMVYVKVNTGAYNVNPGASRLDSLQCTWKDVSYITISNILACESSDAKLYMVNESLSRIAEYNTDNCLQVYSEYLGRPDSAPFEFNTETCAGLMTITKGLLLRNVPIPNNPFAVSFNELITAINTIYPVGYTVENMGVNEVLRVENWDWFYQNMELIDLGDVSANIAPDISLHFKNIKTGYDKYETENYNGLFDIHGEREYTTKLVNHNETIDNTCKFIGSGYAIELTRQQGDTNSKDWRYDNDTFLLCMRRSGDDIIVEQDNITDDDNILDPPTLLNFRITPARMASNWFKFVTAFMRGVREIVFSSGKGNTLAEGRCISGCEITGNVLAENQNIAANDIANDTTPIFTAETVEIKGVPVSFRQYLDIKANPHGLVRYTCGSAGAGWIKEFKYKIVDGTADFILLKSLRN